MAPTPTEVGDVRVKLFDPVPMIMSVENTTPELPAAAPVFKLTETGEREHGGVGPVNAAEMVAPGLTLEPKPGVQTSVSAWAGEAIQGAAKKLIAAAPTNLITVVMEKEK